MIGVMIKLDETSESEEIREWSAVDEIRSSMGTDVDNIDWDSTPAIIVSEIGEILDGHHRVAACKETLGVWRALEVDGDEFHRISTENGHVAAVQWAAEQYEDDMTWGAAQ